MQGDRETLHVSSPEADQIISAHDGDVALLWLYRLRRPEGDLEDAARALCRTLKEMEAAFEKLRRMGLARGEEKPVQPEKQQKLPPADERPEYTAKDLAVRSREDPRFAGLVTEAQRKLGRTLSSSDLKTLFGIYDNLALPTEVIMMLLNYCVSLRPKGNPPSMRQIDERSSPSNRRRNTSPAASAAERDLRRWRGQSALQTGRRARRRQNSSPSGSIWALTMK